MQSCLDRFARPLQKLRVSVTDRCNLRCRYCMPQEEYRWIPRDQILSFEEIGRLVDVFLSLGVAAVRLTGGEPLLRRDLSTLVAALAGKPGLSDLSLTTNGVLLAQQAAALKQAGLKRVNVSLDSLRRERYVRITNADGLSSVIAGIEQARAVGLAPLRINMVVIRGLNDDEIIDLLRFAHDLDAEVRFIEYMDVGGATEWSREQVFARRLILRRITQAFGPARRIETSAHGPAERFSLRDGATFGIVASTTTPFCSSCDRSRLTADGMWFMCLYAPFGVDLRRPLRSDAAQADIAALIQSKWRSRIDRGAEARLADADRGAFVPREELRVDSHLEMHKRGG